MKYISYQREGRHSIGVWEQGKIFDIPSAARSFGNRVMPQQMLGFLSDFEMNHRLVSDMFSQSDPGRRPELFFPDGQATIEAPVTHPQSLRIFTAYDKHRQQIEQKFNLGNINKHSFYFGNHQLFRKGEVDIKMPEHTDALDFEVQLAVVVARQGSNLNLDTYYDYIAGFILMTQIIARNMQANEMSHGFGLGKSVDNPIITGAYLVNKEAFQSFRRRDVIEEDITILLNGDEIAYVQTADMDLNFGEMLVEASRQSKLFPGDILATGGLPGGSLLTSGNQQYLAAGDALRVTSNELGSQKINFLE